MAIDTISHATIKLESLDPHLTPDLIRRYLRSVGITEQLFIHEQDHERFYKEQGIRELGRGGEGAVYFLRGHVVKVIQKENAASSLREIAHMLYLNRGVDSSGALGDRVRHDWPSLLWVYCLSDGSVAVGMKPFDGDGRVPGATLYERLNFGPILGRTQVLRAVRCLCQTMVHAHKEGIIHHDLKPSNIYVPADPTQNICVFDLGQALWKNGAWGREWRRHSHNYLYWYNGTYRYMHRQRRYAHLAAVATTCRLAATQPQADAYRLFMPTFYDDVFSFARIIKDVLRSNYTELSNNDGLMLSSFYQDLMGLKNQTPLKNQESTVLRRLQSAFKDRLAPTLRQDAQIRWPSMTQVLFELEMRLNQ